MRQIKVLSYNSLIRFEEEMNAFLKTYPEAKILGIHPKSMADGTGLIAVLSFVGDIVPYQTLVSDLDKSTEALVKQKDALSEALRIGGEYQVDAQKAANELKKAQDEIKSLRKALKQESPTEDKLDEYDFEVDKIPQEWIDEYEEKTGSKAIWKNEVTKGFKQFAKSNLIK